MVIFSVPDTGIGIAPEHQERIFQEFAQSRTPCSARCAAPAWGCRWPGNWRNCWEARARWRASRAWARHSRPGIPSSMPGPGQSPKSWWRRSWIGRCLPVLVIEDEIEPRLLYEKYLRGTGFQAVAARSLREARALLENVRPAAIILDIMLRGEEGWGLLLELKRARNARSSGVGGHECGMDRHKAMSFGADDFGQKPVERRWLLDHLNKFTGQNPAQDPGDRLDEEVSRYLLRQLFPSPPDQVIEACNSVAGLRLARDEQPQLIRSTCSCRSLAAWRFWSACGRTRGTHGDSRENRDVEAVG